MLPGVIGVRGMAAGGAGGWKVGGIMKGRKTLAAKVVMAKMSSAKVPTRVASSQVLSTSSSVMCELASKNGFT